MLAHNWERSGNGTVPVVIDPNGYPFGPSEREREWHEATDEEYQAYLTYWDKVYGDY